MAEARWRAESWVLWFLASWSFFSPYLTSCIIQYRSLVIKNWLSSPVVCLDLRPWYYVRPTTHISSALVFVALMAWRTWKEMENASQALMPEEIEKNSSYNPMPSKWSKRISWSSWPRHCACRITKHFFSPGSKPDIYIYYQPGNYCHHYCYSNRRYEKLEFNSSYLYAYSNSIKQTRQLV